MNLRRNGLFSAAEVVVNGICLFFIYRNVVEVLGVSMLGVWSLVLATSAFGRAADLGISGSISRYVARSLGEKRPDRALIYMRTGVLFIAVTMGVVALILYWPLWGWLSLALKGSDLDAARSVLPWAILSFWLLIVKTAIDSCLVGVLRADLRSIAGITGVIIQLVLSYLLVGPYGLFGLAWAQLVQFAFALTLEFLFLLTIARVRAATSVSWFSFGSMKEMLGFGVKLQLGSVANLVFEPVVKASIAATAGTHVLGIFEIAYRMAYQVRNVATMALQPTIAAFASLTAGQAEESRDLFKKVGRTAGLATAVLMSGVAAGSPLISWLYLGHVDPLLVFTSGVMGIMWGATIIAAPAYYYGIASGRVMPYVISEFTAVILSTVAVLLSGMGGVVALTVASAAIGKVVGGLILGLFTRPTSRLTSSVLLMRSTWVSSAILLAVCATVITIALPRL